MASWLNKIFRKSELPKANHVVEHAFTVAGVEYFQFQDVFNLPYKRALKALMYYREVSLNCDREFLQAHVQAVRNALSVTSTKKVIDITSAYVMNEQLAQRLQLPPDVEMLYKLASIVYFDKHENPEDYEFEYGAKKIAFWKEHETVESFFLQKPLQELLPFLKEAGENISTYQQMVSTTKNQHLVKILENLSDEQKKQLMPK